MAEESIRTVLGFDADQAIATLRNLNAVLETYNRNMLSAAAATSVFNVRALDALRTLQTLNAAVASTTAAQSGLTSGNKTVAQTLTEVNTAANKVEESVEDTGETTQKVSRQMVLSWQSVIRIFTIQVIHQMISKVTGALTESVQLARDYEIALAEVQTVAHTLGVSFNELAIQARQASEFLGQPLDVVVEAQYQLYSNQVGGATDALLAFNASQKLAIATVSTLNDAVELITGIMNAYGESSANTEIIAAKLFRTIELGRVRAEELSNTLGRISVLGAQLGISLDELLASIAILTISGLKANEALTLISNVQLKLLRPTEELQKIYDKLGITTAEAGIQAYTFQGFLEEIRKQTDGTSSELGDLFGRIRAVRGALGLTGPAAEKYRENLKMIQEASEELLEERMEFIFQTNAKQVEVELNKLRVAVIDNFGRGVNELLVDIFNLFGGAKNTMLALVPAVGAASIAFLLFRRQIRLAAVESAASSTAMVAQAGRVQAAWINTGAAIKAATLAHPILAALAIGTTVATLIGFWNQLDDEAKESVELLKEQQESRIKDALRSEGKLYDERVKQYRNILSIAQQTAIAITKAEQRRIQDASLLESRAYESLNMQLQDRADSFRSFVNSIIGLSDELGANLRELGKDTQAIGRNLEAFNFERQIKNLNVIQQTWALIERGQQLSSEAGRAVQRGEEELAKTLIDNAQQYIDRALQVADTSKNATLIWKAEEAVRLNYREQQALNQKIGDEKIKQARIAEQVLPDLFAQSTKLTELVKKFEASRLEVAKGRGDQKKITEALEEQKRLGAEIEEEMRNMTKYMSLAKALNLQDQFEAAIKSLREGITGTRMDLATIIQFDSTVILNTLNEALDDIELETKKRRLEISLGVVGGAAIQKTLTDQNQALVDQKKTNEAIILRKEELQRLDEYSAYNIKLFSDQLRDQVGWWTRVKADQEKMLEEYEGINIREARNVIDDMAAALQTVRTAYLEGIKAVREGGDLQTASQQISILKEQAQLLSERGFNEAAITASKMAEEIQKGMQYVTELKALQDLPQNLSQQMDTLTGVIRGFGTTSSDVSQQSINATNNITASWAALEKQIKITQAAQAAGGGGGTRRQLGGIIGTDTMPVMLSPGEFVVNAKATRQFYSQLVAMNSIRRQQGGVITQTVGDINITVHESKTPQQTARELMSTFRRELRRGVSILH